jgi:hypothetical protein
MASSIHDPRQEEAAMPKKAPGTPKQPRPPKRARVTLNDSKADFIGRTNVQKGLRTTAPLSPKFNATIKAILDTWSKDTDQAVTLWDGIVTQEAALEQSYTSLGALLVVLGTDRDGFINALQNVCVSEADAQSFGANVVPAAKSVEPGPPTTIRQIDTGVPGQNKIRWLGEPGAASYMADASVDPPTASSWGNCYTGRSPFFVYPGTPGQKVWFKICSVGTAPSAWSTPFLITLR